MKNLNRRSFMKMLAGAVTGCVVAPIMLVAAPEPLPEMPLRGSYIYSKEKANSLGYTVDKPIGIPDFFRQPIPDYQAYRVGDMWTDAEKQQISKVMTNG